MVKRHFAARRVSTFVLASRAVKYMHATTNLRGFECAVLCLGLACSTGARPASDRGSSAGGGSATDASLTGSTTGGAGGSLGTTTTTGGGAPIVLPPDASFSDSSVGVDATCAGSTTVAQVVPLDLFIMLDQSTSMSTKVGMGMETRWTAVTKAITNFVQQPEANGIGVGLNYFGNIERNTACPPSVLCKMDGECQAGCGPCVPYAGTRFCKGSIVDECDLAKYSKAEVAIAPLPGNAQPILDSLARHGPSAGTPTSAALQGAVNFCSQWATDHADHVVVAVFVTDGEPMLCDLNPANIQQIAATAFSATPSIRTFVIGVGAAVTGADAGRFNPGANARQLLNGIASSGGTMQAFMVDDADVNRQFVEALNKIRGTALQCAYTLPDSMGRMIDIKKVNVRYTPGGSTTSEVIPKVANEADCAMRDGWYYDNEAAPTRIIVCPATCDRFSRDTKGKVEIEVGCATIIAPPPR
jgi:hypothetical protein